MTEPVSMDRAWGARGKEEGVEGGCLQRTHGHKIPDSKQATSSENTLWQGLRGSCWWVTCIGWPLPGRPCVKTGNSVLTDWQGPWSVHQRRRLARNMTTTEKQTTATAGCDSCWGRVHQVRDGGGGGHGRCHHSRTDGQTSWKDYFQFFWE